MNRLKFTTVIVVLGLVARLAPAGEPTGAVQVWNCGRWQTVSVGDFKGVNPQMKSLKPIVLLAARNGVASGYVLVTRDGGPITGLKATVSDLKQIKGTGAIPAARVQVRYAGRAVAGKRGAGRHSWMPHHRFDRLLEKPPAKVAAVGKISLRASKRKFTSKNTSPVATVPVWVTVRVPADAAPGDYEGSLSIHAAGLAGGSVKVPIKLKVHDWKMPEPKDFRVRTIGWMNPEALATNYGVKLWSDKHFELMGKSMELMLELGSRHLPIDVTKGYPARLNSDTMIKWVKQPDGSYKYDFTVFDKYCDLAAKKIGKPFPLRLNIWRGPGGRERDDYPNATVLVLDPATKQVTELAGPSKMGSPEMKKFWKPFLDQMRTRLEKRGWFDVTGTNWMCYCVGVTKEMASMMLSIWPDGKWTDVTHGRVRRYRTTKKGVFAPVFVQSTVWREGTIDRYRNWKSGPYPRQYAGKFNPQTAWCTHARNQYREATWPALWTLRNVHELAILKGNDGLECVGADHFPGMKDGRGRLLRNPPWGAYAQGPRNGTCAILGAGDKGPLGTERFEAMREGIQLCEAMVFIQKSLEARKINGDLAARANKLLDDRAKAMVGNWKTRMVKYGKRTRKQWYFDMAEYAKGAAQRDDALYAMAAEVAKAMSRK
jgi:Glycoside hydrolase 123, catalytic domain/Glycoside hydrolase 123 N-terminal domain